MLRIWKICGLVSGVLATVFVIFGGVGLGYSIESISWLAAAGAILGAISAPEFQPKAFRYPAIWQISFAILGCTILAGAVSAPLEWYLLAVPVGIGLGYLAPYWIKHIQAP